MDKLYLVAKLLLRLVCSNLTDLIDKLDKHYHGAKLLFSLGLEGFHWIDPKYLMDKLYHDAKLLFSLVGFHWTDLMYKLYKYYQAVKLLLRFVCLHLSYLMDILDIHYHDHKLVIILLDGHVGEIPRSTLLCILMIVNLCFLSLVLKNPNFVSLYNYSTGRYYTARFLHTDIGFVSIHRDYVFTAIEYQNGVLDTYSITMNQRTGSPTKGKVVLPCEVQKNLRNSIHPISSLR